MAKSFLCVSSVLLAAGAMLAAHGQSAQPGSDGKSIAAAQCQACHGLDGKGVAPGIPNLAGQRARYLVKTFEEFRDGTRAHASLQAVVTGLSAAQARAVARYYATLPPVPPTATKLFDAYAIGQRLAAGCADCHGSDGDSTTPGVPSLAGQQPHYLFNATQEYMTGERNAAPMIPALGRLRRLDVESMALYYSSQMPIPHGAPSTGDAQTGRTLSAVCSGCHGATGISTDTDTPSLAGLDAKYLADAIASYRSGQRKNEAMSRAVAKLTDQDIADIAAFYSSQRSKPAQHGQTLVGQTVAKCDRCHAAGVENPALAIPVIAGQDEDYLAMALRAYRDGQRGSSVMHYMSVPLDDAVIESVASHYANAGQRR